MCGSLKTKKKAMKSLQILQFKKIIFKMKKLLFFNERNSKKIMGADSDFIIDINRSAVGLVFVNDAQGWLQIER